MQGNDSIKFATSILDYVFRELAVSYLERFDLAHVDPNEVGGYDALGKGVEEGKPQPNFISKGLTRSRADKLSVVSSSDPSPSSGDGVARSAMGGVSNVTAFAGSSGGRANETAGATALKSEPEARLSPAQQLETRNQPTQPTAKQVATERRLEAKAKGYEGDACGECQNYTLVRNGTCMKCDSCGATSGCS